MTTNQLNNFFLKISEELDIPNSLFDRAETSYLELGKYISNHCNSSVNIYTQGSFRLGIVIRPLSDEDVYDLDLVCEVKETSSITPKDLKKMVGDILRDSKRYSLMLEEKKRCWRIEYSDEAQFHMDITPAIPHKSSTGFILVTNKNEEGSYSFSDSNPKGYSGWFEKRKATTVMIQKAASFGTKEVEPIKTENNKIKLPLQRAIQILKRHRDKTFEHNPDFRPISIIITTLAAHAYKGEMGVYDALQSILENMSSFIKINNGNYYILNPSNQQENFADKWNIEPNRAKACFDWIEKVKNDVLMVSSTITDDLSILGESFGKTVIDRVISATYPIAHNSDLPVSEYSSPTIKEALDVPHRQKLPFKLPKQQVLGISAIVIEDGVPRQYTNNGLFIPKNCSIDFNLICSSTLLKDDYSVLWQVVNTGNEAQAANGLRGGFVKENNTIKHHESTLYRGTHFVQAFLIKHGNCIAMSKEFIVNIQ